MQRQIEFTKTAFSSVYGTFGPGDVARFDESVARHFVEDAYCAKFIDAQVKADEPTEAVPVATIVKKVKKATS